MQDRLEENGIKVFGGPRASHLISIEETSDLKKNCGEAALTAEVVESLEKAVDYIHKFGSSHTDCIATGRQCIPSSFSDPQNIV